MKHRGIVMSKKGMVSSAHTLISASGLKILNNGGNAIDATIAMALTSSVVLPDMCGLGGDAFMLYYDAKTKTVTAINGSGPAPLKASLEYFKENGYQSMPKDGILSVSVPGAVDVYFTSLEKYGTKSFAEVSQDAITLAENGVPLSEKVIRHMHSDYAKMLRFDNLRNRYLTQDLAYLPGDSIYNLEYAESLRFLAKKGRDAFYNGDLTDKIIDYSHKKAGLLEKEDFANYHCQIVKPIYTDYRDYRIYQTPPVSQGIILLEEMAILNQFDISQYLPDSAEAIHLMVEAKKIAFFDRINYFGDPSFITNPIKEILSESYIKKMASKIDSNSCLNEKDLLIHDQSHTTSMVAIDQEGNAVSFIHSISASWGSGEIVDGTGILLNNRASAFSLIPNHPNLIAPGKRTMHTLNTYLITDTFDLLRYVGNTPGGDNQPQWNMQVICNLLDFKLDVQSAVEHAKWTDIQTIDEHNIQQHILTIESQAGEEVIRKLRAIGHIVKVVEPFGCSGASQIIEVRPDGLRLGGSDPRADGAAMPQI